MKFNFWQVLGTVLLIVALVMIFRREANKSATQPRPPATTLPQ